MLLLQVRRMTGFSVRVLACAGVLAFATAAAYASSVDLSTGLDATNTLITVGNIIDGHWTVDQPLGGIAPARVVTPTDVDWPGAWLANGPASAWIAIDASTYQNAPVIPYTYYRTFTLTPADLPTAAISGFWGIDDGGEVRLNGNLVSASPGNYTVTQPLSVPTGSSLFVVGLNTLTITMTTSDNVWEAVRLEGTLTGVNETVGTSSAAWSAIKRLYQ